ncbi:MAG TPA: AmmeMemoRadiSam system protein A [Thermoanaerobaculia bacterium]|nr:AmmeMemoRadiSam system protein A [Thermoanaerobaculia bacterium]
MLDDDQRKRLLNVARQSIASVLEGRPAEWRAEDFDDDLRKPAGAFVTLRTRDGDLRGCIGSIYPTAPLYRAVAASAVNAAFRDPRFFPLQREELPHITIEISVMGPLEPVADVGSIEVGRDGLIVSRGRSAGLLLPQVATEHGWDRETFLSQTCVKAGLPPDAWRSPECRIERFTAEVFSE